MNDFQQEPSSQSGGTAGLWIFLGLFLVAAGFCVYFWMQGQDASTKLAELDKQLMLKKYEAESLAGKVKDFEENAQRTQRDLGVLKQQLDGLERERNKLSKTVDEKFGAAQKDLESSKKALDVCVSQHLEAKKLYEAEQQLGVALRQQLEDCGKKLAALETKKTDAPAASDVSRRPEPSGQIEKLEKELKECRNSLTEQQETVKLLPTPATLEKLNAELNACLKRPVPPPGASKAEIEAMEKRAKEAVQETAQAYEGLIKNLKKEIADKNVVIEQQLDKVSLVIVGQVLFNFASITISKPGAELLDKIAPTLAGVKGKKIYIVGHTDDKVITPNFAERFPSNWELSGARAAAVIRYLTERKGVDPALLAAVGHGQYSPVAPNDKEADRARNRRVEIVIAPGL
jgi:flagellar motor protein MotB